MAGVLCVVRCPVSSAEDVHVPVYRCCWFAAVLQVEQVEVGLGTVQLGGLALPHRRGGDELLQGLAVVILQV